MSIRAGKVGTGNRNQSDFSPYQNCKRSPDPTLCLDSKRIERRQCPEPLLGTAGTNPDIGDWSDARGG